MSFRMSVGQRGIWCSWFVANDWQCCWERGLLATYWRRSCKPDSVCRVDLRLHGRPSFIWECRYRHPHATYPRTCRASSRCSCLRRVLLFGLAQDGVCRAGLSPNRWCALTTPFHPYRRRPFSLRVGGLLSVALSVGLPRLAVSQHPALLSPDFPPWSKVIPLPV